MHKADILIIEDNESDSTLIQEAIKETVMASSVFAVKQAEDAMKFLQQKGPYKGKSRPDLIIMDLKMPNVDGHEFLKTIKSDKDFGLIPVIILTGSDSDDDITRSYKLHANCYIVKPVNFIKFKRVVSVINDFWLGVAKLPPKQPPT
ncbi:MAG: response regulator [Alphaproteobacteria bacterium]